MDRLKRIKNIICYAIGVACIVGAFALLGFASFRPETRTFTLIAVFALGFVAVIAMDLVDTEKGGK